MPKFLKLKKWKFVLCVALACMMLAALPVHADSGIKVIIDDQEVQFDQSPVVDQGTTLVPFRVLFEKLGLQVDWIQATKTIVGKGEGVTIQLQLERKTAVINGMEVEMTTAPRIIDGATYVPLRLVGEATGRTVIWDGTNRTITIGAAPETESFDFEAFYRSFIAAYNAEDLEAVLSWFHPESPILDGLEEQLVDNFRNYDIVTEVEIFEFYDADDTTALLNSIETNVNTNDRFYMDNRTDVFIDLLKDENGDWKIYDVTIFDLEFLVSEDVLTADADIDADVEKALLGVIETNVKAVQAEDLKAMMATIDPSSPAYDATAESYGLLFLLFDFELKLEYANVVSVTDTEAFVYTVQSLKISDEEFVEDVRTKEVHYLKKQADGSWKFYTTYEIGSEPLE